MARMNRLLTRLLVALALVFVSAPAMAQWQVTAHAVPIGKGPGVIGFGSATAGASGTVFLGKGTTTDPAFVALSQDCTVASTGVITCTKTNNVSFAPSATTDTTNAANISSGLLPNARLDAEVQCIAGLTSAADKLPYFTGSGTCALADLSSAERTYLTTSSSANLRAVLTDEVGTGAAYFVGGALGTPASVTLTNGTGLPISGITGLGTGIGTALAVNVGSAGAPVLFNGAGGTPSSLTLTNATSLPISGLTASTSLAIGVGTIELGNASDTTLARSSAGNVTIEGNAIYRASGTDVAVADGGTGQSTAPLARSSSGLNIDQATTQGDADKTIAATDRTIVTTTTLTAARTDTLPAANSVNAGQHVVVADMAGAINGTNTLTVQRAGSDTINGVSTVALSAQYGYVDLISDGTSKWTYQAASGGGGGSGTVTNATIAAGTGISVSGTCAITTSGTCTVRLTNTATTVNGQTCTLGSTCTISAGFTLGTPIATTSGTTADWTSLPAGIKQIILTCAGFSTNNTGVPIVQLGDATTGGFITIGYLATASAVGASPVAQTTGFPFTNTWAAAAVVHGAMTFTLLDSSTNTWSETIALGRTDTANTYVGGGSVSLAGALDRLRLTTVGGNTFDAGKCNVTSL